MSSKKPSFPHKNPFKSQEAKGLLQSSEPSLLGPQGKNHPKSPAPASHDPNRKKCCLGCYRYTKIALTDSLKDAIPSLFERFSGCTVWNLAFPYGLSRMKSSSSDAVHQCPLRRIFAYLIHHGILILGYDRSSGQNANQNVKSALSQ